MSTWLLTALAVVVLALGALLWQGLRDGPQEVPEVAPPTATTPASPPRPASPANPRSPAPAVEAQPAEDPGEADEAARAERDAIGRFVTQVVPRELYAVAAECYRDEPGDHQAMTIRYQLTVSDGTATIGRVEMASSELDSPRLEGCIVDILNGHTWEVADGFTVEEDGEPLSLTINGLRKLHR